MNLVDMMDARLYPEHSDRWDDQLFRREILAILRPEHRMLDLGAGAGIVPEMNFRGLAAEICGVDPDERVTENPFIDEGRVGRGEQIPFSDESFDIVIADNVLEHLENPAEVFGEVARVLKPSGHFLAKTPNLWHYMPTIARLTPHSFHQFFNRLRGREGEDTFPTRYRANTRAALERWAASAGFRVERARVIEGRPEYLRLNPITYAMGWAYERAVNGIPGLERFRVLLIADMVKLPTAASRQ